MPRCIGRVELEPRILNQDKKAARRFGPCAVGEKALYLNSFYIERRFYVAVDSVRRVFKRVAMSKGGYTGKGLFASIPYLVVVYDDGQEKQCIFKEESQVDAFLDCMKRIHPEIPRHSIEAERRLEQKRLALAVKQEKLANADAREEILTLQHFREYLKDREELARNLSEAARRKRACDRSNPAYKWVALAIVIMGAVSLVYGVWALMMHQGLAMYFLLFGLAAIFLFSGANVLPTSRNNRRYVEGQLKDALEKMERYVKEYPDAPVPARYAHPAVLDRMAEILADRRAGNVVDALAVLKDDLRKLNSDVEVEQEEFEEIMSIKPIFLVMNYR